MGFQLSFPTLFLLSLSCDHKNHLCYFNVLKLTWIFLCPQNILDSTRCVLGKMHALPLSNKMFIRYLLNLINIVPVSYIMIDFSVAPSIIKNVDWKCLIPATAICFLLQFCKYACCTIAGIKAWICMGLLQLCFKIHKATLESVFTSR